MAQLKAVGVKLGRPVKSNDEQMRGRAAELMASGKSWRVRIDDNDMLVMPVMLGRSATLGGVGIDGGGRVLTASGEHVEGLFAAGEITGGVHGMRCVPGNLSLESVVFGREAGFAAAGRSA